MRCLVTLIFSDGDQHTSVWYTSSIEEAKAEAMTTPGVHSVDAVELPINADVREYTEIRKYL